MKSYEFLKKDLLTLYFVLRESIQNSGEFCPFRSEKLDLLYYLENLVLDEGEDENEDSDHDDEDSSDEKEEFNVRGRLEKTCEKLSSEVDSSCNEDIGTSPTESSETDDDNETEGLDISADTSYGRLFKEKNLINVSPYLLCAYDFLFYDMEGNCYEFCENEYLFETWKNGLTLFPRTLEVSISRDEMLSFVHERNNVPETFSIKLDVNNLDIDLLSEVLSAQEQI